MTARNYLWLVAALCLVLGMTSLVPAATFTVTKTGDSGTGTLREKIEAANALPGPDIILFNITGGGGVKTINVTNSLPIIIDPVTIDGWSQGGAGYTGPPLIEVSGSGMTLINNGLEFWSGFNTVRGLIINRFPAAGIALVTNGNNTIQGNYIGTDAAGALNRGNTNQGIVIVNSPGNLIGGSNAAVRNVISGNRFGIALLNNNARNNVIQGNYIGLNAAGSAPIPNREDGILLDALLATTEDDYASDNMIGGTIPGSRNVISGNGGAGILGFAIGSGTLVGPTRNRIIGNYIGTAPDGVTAIPNIGAGIELDKASGNIIGGLATPAERNIISGNITDGVFIENSRTNIVQGNFIGTDVTGLLSRGNLLGVTILGGSGNIIGGSNGMAGNVISGNALDGVQLGLGTTNNQVIGNMIGLSATGQVIMPNLRHGVSIFDSSHNGIGGAGLAANQIVGNGSNGVFIGRGGLNAGSISNVVQGNTIAQNGLDGVQLSGGASGNRVVGDVIGAGQAPGGANFLGNSRHGVSILDSTNNLIGGSLNAEHNYISGNRTNGIFIGSASVSNYVRGNRIGTTPVGNGAAGVFIQGTRNVIGGFTQAERNLIAFNGTMLPRRGHGVVVESGTNNAIIGNAIWANSGRGIDLGNDSFTVNDLSDEDVGANDLQNYPAMAGLSIDRSQGRQETGWSFQGQPAWAYYFEFFANSAPDPSGFGEGQRLINTSVVITDEDGFAGILVPAALTDLFISGTATDLTNMNTSEFSPVDTDADCIADAWETGGIDYNEDGTVDLILAGANPRHKDIFIEIDAMLGRAPNMDNLRRVALGTGRGDGFHNAPADLVNNPDGRKGVTLHLELDETDLPFETPWVDPTNQPFLSFDKLKTNYFGTLAQFPNTNALNAKRLVYRYCIFADDQDGLMGATRGPFANDFYIALGAESSSPTSDQLVSTFMHELGHVLGLDHGGVDEINIKPNYHSTMNMVCRPNGPTLPWRLDFSREEFAPLDENSLDENVGIGAPDSHAGHTVIVGPTFLGTNTALIGLRVPEVGPVDWNGNGSSNEVNVVRNLDFFFNNSQSNGASLQPLAPSEDWSRLRYYFLDSRFSQPGYIGPWPNDLNPTLLEALEKLGTGAGMLQISQDSFSVSETGGVAVISVSRIFEAEGNVSVSFSALNGTATHGLDFVATNGVLTFIGAETLKQFAVPILNDGVAEEPETVRLVLSSPTAGAILGPRALATLVIEDEDSPGHFTVSNTNNSGAGSLRQAILDANAASGLGIIDFNIPGSSGLTISPSGALPGISNRITIDGTTQAGFAGTPLVELNGSSVGAGADGLRIFAGHCTVRGLVINRFNGNGITLLLGDENHIEGCYLGLNRLGTLDQGNAGSGINVQSAKNIIGGSTAAARNFISGNNSSGVDINGNSATNNQVQNNVIGLGTNGSDQGNSSSGISLSASQNIIGGEDQGNVISGNDSHGVNILSGIEDRILGNYIGTDLTGSIARGNAGNGLNVIGTGHVIGGDDPGAANVISGNGLRGIDMPSAFSVRVLGNRIGTDNSGQSPLPNQAGGIMLIGQANQIGNTNGFGANTIAFNNGPGVFVTHPTISVNNSIRGNSIFSNFSNSPFPDFSLGIDLGAQGITVNDTNDTDVGANQLQNFPLLMSASNSFAGTTITGSLNSRPNTNYIIDFYANAVGDPSGFGEGQSWIGSTKVTTDGSGNAAFTAVSAAIYLVGRNITATATDAAGSTSEFSPPTVAESSMPGRTFTVENVNDSGEGSLRKAILDANSFNSERDTIAFDIPGSGLHTIRPLSPLPIITDPVLIDAYTQPGALPNTAATGHNGVLRIELDGSLATAAEGLRIEGGDSIVRGLVINRFAANAEPSVFPAGLKLSMRGGNRIEGNFIGTDPTGFLDRGNGFCGVMIFQCSSNVIGGTLAAARNVISGNDPGGSTVSGDGVAIYGDSTRPFPGNRIEGNLIGTAADGFAALGNGGRGVLLASATNATIGGIAPGAGNLIAFNAFALPLNDACGVQDPQGSGTAVLGNSIHSNAGRGIGGNLVNSVGGRGNFPFLSSGFSSNGLTTIQGRLQSVSNALHRIELFANDTFDLSSFGEGKIFLGATNVPTDSNGFVAFTAVLPVPVSNGMFLSATATDDRNNTSEFSPRFGVGDVLTNVIVVNSFNEVDDGVANATHTSLREAILAANNHPGPDLIRFAIGTGAKFLGVSNSPPALMDPGTTIDATTQPGYAGKPVIALDGLFLSSAGFRLYAPSNTIRGFAINRFGIGIYCDGAFSSPFGGFNNIEGNYLGTDLSGSGAVGSQDYGIYIFSGCPSNRIGGATVASRNVISGNNRAGVFIFDSAGNTLAGNFVGTDPTGTNVVGNGIGIQPIGGLFIQRGQRTVVGGSAPGMGNLISGNASLFQNQLFLWDDCSGSVVEGNFIGMDLTGRTNLGNSMTSIDVTGSGGVLIKSNLLSGLGFTATIYLASSSNRVEGNFIGTDVTGTRAIPGVSRGVLIDNGTANIIGGTNAGSRNLLSAAQYGVRINGPSNVVQGNFIGTQIDGVSPLGNASDGVIVLQSFNQIGGVGPGAGNTIAFNAASGVFVSAGTNNAILGNSIFSNSVLGIDLGVLGVTTNDVGDLDNGPNNLQNFPVLSAARNIGPSTILEGTLNSRNNTFYRIEFFSNTNCDSSGSGEGRTFLNATTATTDGSGNALISFTHPVAIPAGQKITATATDPNNNTSEFSPCVGVINDTNHVVLLFSSSAPYALSWPASAANFLLERSTNLASPVIWQVISNGIVTNAGNKVFLITNDPASPELFFRLRKP